MKSELEKLCERRRVKADATYGAPDNDSFPESDPWTVRLRYRGRRLTVPFYTGYGSRERHPNGPTAADVLSCLCSDASSAEQSFEEWCSDFGYDVDSRKAEATYKACERIAVKLNRFLGDDLDEFSRAEH